MLEQLNQALKIALDNTPLAMITLDQFQNAVKKVGLLGNQWDVSEMELVMADELNLPYKIYATAKEFSVINSYYRSERHTGNYKKELNDFAQLDYQEQLIKFARKNHLDLVKLKLLMKESLRAGKVYYLDTYLNDLLPPMSKLHPQYLVVKQALSEKIEQFVKRYRLYNINPLF